MQMSEILDKLKSLQDVLADKYEIEAKKDELPKTLDGSKASLEHFQKEYIAKNAEYEEEKTKVSALRAELEEATKAREAGEKGMDEISSHREYEVLDKQISEAQEKESRIRKDLQKEEKILAELNDKLKEDEDLIESMKKDVNEAQENIDRELGGYQDRLKKLEEQEKELSEGIDSETVFKFQRIIQRNSKGIVAVKGQVCDGCHMVLPAQFANEVHRGDKILFCPYCSRILYYEESEQNDDIISAMNNIPSAGSLADLDDDLFDEGTPFDDGDETSGDDVVSDEDDVKSSMEYEE